MADTTPALDQRVEPWRRNLKLWQEEYERGSTRVASRPSWITLDTGAVCNLRCVHCPRENPAAGFVEYRTDPGVVERLADSLPYLQRLTLYGLGEPLLSDVFWRVIEDDRTRSIPHVDANTNGTLLSEKNVERLLASHLSFLKISIDGATSRTYQRIRGGRLEKVLAGVRNLTRRRRELGRTDFMVWVSMTLMVENIRELPMMVDLACELETDALWAQHLQMRSDGSQDDWRLGLHGWTFAYNEEHLSNAPALSNQMVRLTQERAAARGFTFALDPELWLPEPGAAAPAVAKSPPKSSRRRISDCHQPWEWLVVDPLGGVQPCCFASQKVGNVKSQTVGEVWNGATMVRLRRSIRDGYVDRVCRNAGCVFVRETEKAHGLDAYDLRYEMGTEIGLGEYRRPGHCLSGWSAPESWGVWSQGERATLLLQLAEKPRTDLQLEILCRGIGHPTRPRSFVRVSVNERELDRLEFRYPDSTESSVWRRMRVPAAILTSPRLAVGFLVESPVAPTAWGAADGRLLGIGLSALKVQPIP